MCNTSTALVRSLVIWDHAVLPATRQRWVSRLYPRHVAGTHLSTPEGWKAELTYLAGWLYQDGLPRDGRPDLNYVNGDQRATTKPGHHHGLVHPYVTWLFRFFCCSWLKICLVLLMIIWEGWVFCASQEIDWEGPLWNVSNENINPTQLISTLKSPSLSLPKASS